MNNLRISFLGEAIVKRLTTDRIKELRKLIEAETIELMQLEDECKILSDDNISDEKLKEIEIAIEKEEKAEAEQKAIHENWLKEREEKKQAILAALKAHTSKLPLKGAAAAAVQQAGAARRASTQSERSSFSGNHTRCSKCARILSFSAFFRNKRDSKCC